MEDSHESFNRGGRPIEGKLVLDRPQEGNKADWGSGARSVQQDH